MIARRLESLCRLRWLLSGALACVCMDTLAATEKTSGLVQGQDIVTSGGIVRVVLGFLVTAGIAVGAAFVLRRWGPKLSAGLGGGSRVRVLERNNLGSGLRVHLLSVDDQRVLVAENRHGVALTILHPNQERPTP